MADPATVAGLLAAARAEHDAYKRAANRRNESRKPIPNYTEAEAHVAEALRLRLAADRMDLSHTDAAWASDRGQHGELIAFYQRYPSLP